MASKLLHRFRSLNGRIRPLQPIARPLAALAACALFLVLLSGFSLNLDYYGVVEAVRVVPHGFIWISLVLAIVSYVALIARDESALRYAGVKRFTPVTLFASFCSSALGNALSFRALTADAVRDRIYGAVGVRPEQTARAVTFIQIAFTLGLAIFTAGGLVGARDALPQLLSISVRSLRCVAVLMTLSVVAILFRIQRHGSEVAKVWHPSESSALATVLLETLASVIDLTATAAALWVLLPRGRIDFFSFATVFSAATLAGVIGRVPAGLGTFDIVIFLGFSGFLSADSIGAALLIYRGVYFVLPVLIAATSWAGLELRSASGRGAWVTRGPFASQAAVLAPVFLGVITFAIGALLVVSGATPALDWRLAALQEVLPLWAIEISHLLAALAGVFLLFVARGLYHRLDGAWWLALLVALINVGLSLAKGLAFYETTAIIFLVFLLLATRDQFTRPAAFLHQPFGLGWFVAIAVVITCAAGVLLFAFRDVAYRREIWWQFEFDAQASRSLRAILGASILALGMTLWQLLQVTTGRVTLPSERDLSQAADIIRKQERSAAMLALMGDKSLLFSNSGDSFLMYAKRGRSWITLFDPVGPRREWPELVWRFVELADAHGGRAAFYQIRQEDLSVYLDAGLRIVKVGEEACIYLEQFSLEGPQRYGLRQAVKRGEREGLTFEILSPERPYKERCELKYISERWLANRRSGERGFSVAAYEPGFVSAQSAAVSYQHGKPLAFATFMTTDLQDEATIGLLRQLPDAPVYTMEFIFTRLALELKTRQLKMLSLGMAPLAGIRKKPLSSRWHLIAALLWEHGSPIYNFRGLRSFKNKFRPVWEPRYLAASGAAGPFISLADVAMLASGYKKRLD